MMREHAVSPVVGTMLLITVTIVIAAAVALAASSLSQASEQPPAVELAVTTYGDYNNFTLIFEHRGGEILNPENIRVTTKMSSPDGYYLSNNSMLSNFTAGYWQAGQTIQLNKTRIAECMNISTDILNTSINRSRPAEFLFVYLPTSSVLADVSVLLTAGAN
ncbi:MAG: type IV pilin N-terminal domain-containing protein [Methanocorpusculum sp.]|nr:type IV pilin N-terminal domain-containing protein [Methanocorpusculum sp.]